MAVKKYMKKHKDIIIVMASMGLIVLGVAALTGLQGSGAPSQTALLSNAISTGDWTAGNPGARATIIEYADFECPACGAYHPIVKRLVSEYSDRIRFVYRYFPLRQIHWNAELAADAAEAAGRQGKFWEMHDSIFENQAKWSVVPGLAREEFTRYASSLGLDMKKFAADIDSQSVKDRIESDYQSGIAAGVDHTPTFFLNGRQIQNPQNYEEFKNLLDVALSEK